MAKVPYGVETLPKISIAWVGRTNVTDDRRQTTDGRTMTYSEHELEFTFAKKQRLVDVIYGMVQNQMRYFWAGVGYRTVPCCKYQQKSSSLRARVDGENAPNLISTGRESAPETTLRAHTALFRPEARLGATKLPGRNRKRRPSFVSKWPQSKDYNARATVATSKCMSPL